MNFDFGTDDRGTLVSIGGADRINTLVTFDDFEKALRWVMYMYTSRRLGKFTLNDCVDYLYNPERGDFEFVKFPRLKETFLQLPLDTQLKLWNSNIVDETPIVPNQYEHMNRLCCNIANTEGLISHLLQRKTPEYCHYHTDDALVTISQGELVSFGSFDQYFKMECFYKDILAIMERISRAPFFKNKKI